jgi:predicted P-loop ATPase
MAERAMSAAKTFQSQYQRANSSLLANLPGALTMYKSWVVWKEGPPGAPGKKNKKLPLDPLTLDGKDWNNPNGSHWVNRATAVQVFEKNPALKGIGFVFSNGKTGDPYTFFDLDRVIVKGKLLPWATEFVSMVISYTEISATGTGIKIIIRAKVGERRKSFEFTDSKGKVHEIEVYDCNKFFAATGNRLEGTPESISGGQELLDTLHPPSEEKEETGPPIDRSADEYAADVDAIPDDKLLGKILASKQKTKFKSLWEGSTAGYPGYFTASGALCSILAFWTRANPERIDKLYRQSGLFEKNWWEDDCYAGEKSRREYVIEAACRKAAAKDMYTPSTSGLIVNDDGRIKPIMANAITMLKTWPCWDGVLAFNRLTNFPVKMKPAPWEEHSSGQWTDFDDTKLEEWFQRHRLYVESSKKAGEAAQAIAHENSFHPVLDYLDTLKWDGTARLDTWLTDHLGVKNDEYTRAVGRCWMISAVARMCRPGCQADYTLLLEGNQGILKSSALRTLAGDEFFVENFVEMETKDSLLKLHSAWIVEMGELSSLKRSDIDKVKAFLTCRTDHFRKPYDRRVQPHPRTNVFSASVNRDTPFTDETGNRRFWPVRCEKIELEKLCSNRNQLWAEAAARFKKGEHWWLDTPKLNELAEKEQSERYQPGHWDEIIGPWLECPTQRVEIREDGSKVRVEPWDGSTKDEVTVSDVLIHGIGKSVDRWTHSDEHTVSKYLKSNKWERVSVWRDGKTRRVYKRPGLTGSDLKGNL